MERNILRKIETILKLTRLAPIDDNLSFPSNVSRFRNEPNLSTTSLARWLEELTLESEIRKSRRTLWYHRELARPR